jgi:hypothetical protein
MQQLLDARLSERVDAVSFHLYGARPAALRPLIERLATLRGRNDQPIEIWQSEGAYNIPVRSWLQTMRNPEALPELVGALTGGFAQQLVLLKALGVDRNFHYPAVVQQRYGRVIYRNDFAYGDDAWGNPLPLWAAHAAAVKMLEGARPDRSGAIQELEFDGQRMWLATFRKEDGQLIRVAWTDGPAISGARLNQPPDARALDTMTNPLGLLSQTEIDWRPVYILPTIP